MFIGKKKLYLRISIHISCKTTFGNCFTDESQPTTFFAFKGIKQIDFCTFCGKTTDKIQFFWNCRRTWVFWKSVFGGYLKTLVIQKKPYSLEIQSVLEQLILIKDFHTRFCIGTSMQYLEAQQYPTEVTNLFLKCPEFYEN